MFKKIKKYLVKISCLIISSTIPKKNNLWIFGAWMGESYSDNPKYFFEYMSLHHKGKIKCVWISKNKETVKIVSDKGYDAEYYKSIKGIIYQLRASIIFVSHSVSSDLNSLAIGINTKRVQLWHGAPFKKIGFDDRLYTSNAKRPLYFYKLISFINNDFYNYYVSSGDFCSELYKSAFNVSREKIWETGFPRNSVFNHTQSKPKSERIEAIYMPTFRGNVGDHYDLLSELNFQFDNIEKLLIRNKIRLTIRLHPANYPTDDLISYIKNSKHILLDETFDIYETINYYDVLITDYSSIMFDFYLSKKPIILAPIDINKYLNEDRELYFDYKDLLVGPLFDDWGDIINALLKEGGNVNSINKNKFSSYHYSTERDSNDYNYELAKKLKVDKYA